MVPMARLCRLFREMTPSEAFRKRAAAASRKPSRNSSRANSTNSCSSVSPRRFLNETKCDMEDPPQGRDRAECFSPVGAEDVVAGGRAGRVEGRCAATGGDGAGTAVDQDDIDAGRR